MPSDRSPRSGRTTTFQFIRRLPPPSNPFASSHHATNLHLQSEKWSQTLLGPLHVVISTILYFLRPEIFYNIKASLFPRLTWHQRVREVGFSNRSCARPHVGSAGIPGYNARSTAQGIVYPLEYQSPGAYHALQSDIRILPTIWKSLWSAGGRATGYQ